MDSKIYKKWSVNRIKEKDEQITGETLSTVIVKNLVTFSIIKL